jgi:hypothetical protein
MYPIAFMFFPAYHTIEKLSEPENAGKIKNLVHKMWRH